ncbi:MAG: FHA domain-containing protein [Armatimonadetes bacterium]|nr:FHA domain-containing protein [Armatimonadota bacterium]
MSFSAAPIHLCVEVTDRGGARNFRLRSCPEGPWLTAETSITRAERWEVEEELALFGRALLPSPFAAARKPEAAEHVERLSELARRRMPPALVQELEQLGSDRGRPLRLETDEQAMPWELARLRQGRLGECFSVSRLEPGYRAGPVRLACSPGDTQRALILGDADGLLPWAREELELVRKLLEPRVAVDLRMGPEATPGALRQALDGRRYGIVHLVAFVGDREMFLAGGSLLADELRPAGASPAMGFLHLVSATAPPLSLLAGSHRWAQSFRATGVHSVVLSQWDLDPEEARAYVRSLYGELLGGGALFQATRAARRAISPPAAEALVSFGPSDLILDNMWPLRSGPGATVESALSADCVLRVLEGPDQGLEVPLILSVLEGGRPLIVGSAGPLPCELELEDPELENQAARLLVESGGLYIERIGEVRVNGLAVRGRVPLQRGDVIELGSTRLALEHREPRTGRAPARRGPAAAGRYGLLIVQGRELDLGQEAALRDGISVIGRDAGCTVRLHDPKVSRQHFSVILRDGIPYLNHAGSNPTILNGIPVSQEVRLQHGSLIQVGDTQLHFFDSQRERR